MLVLVAISAFFSGSETGIMALNKYRLRHLVKKELKSAMRTQELLKRPDRLLGAILIGNTFMNIIAASIATLLASRFFGDLGIFLCTLLFSLFILIFAEVMPKTIAALYPEKVSLGVSSILRAFYKLIYPLVYIVNGIANGLLRPFGIKVSQRKIEPLSADELRSVVDTPSSTLTTKPKHMLLGVLDLQEETIEDVMIPKHKIVSINLDDDWSTTLNLITKSPYSKLPVCRGNIDNIIGILHLRKALLLLQKPKIISSALEKLIEPAYFIPEHTSLEKQLINFQQQAEHLGIVVDEYGDIQGLVTVEDILEEIVGEITSTDEDQLKHKIKQHKDGSFMMSADLTLRDINRETGLKLPIKGPKTLSGLIIEHLETLPEGKTSMIIGNYIIEVIVIKDNAITKAKVKTKI